MADFPTSLLSITDPTSGSLLSSPSHSSQHQSHNAEILATQTKIGTGSSTPSSGTVLRGTGAGTSAWGGLTGSDVDSSTGSGSFVLSSAPTLTSPVIATSLDMNGTELILDADGDTSITADTDDQIDIKINANDDFRFTANTFTALSGSSIVTPSLTVSSSLTLPAGSLETQDYAVGSVTVPKLTATYYQANVSGSGAVTSASFANFPTNRCKVDVVTANANAVIEVSYTAQGAYAGATGSTFLQFTLAGSNTGTSTYSRRGQNSDSSQRVPMDYTEIVTLANAGTTTVEMQIAGSATSTCVAENVVLTVKVLQDKG